MNKNPFATLDISDELKSKAMATTDPRELLALAREAGIELTDEQLEGIAGGGEWSDELESAAAGAEDDPGDTRDDIDEALVSEAFRTGADLGDDVD